MADQSSTTPPKGAFSWPVRVYWEDTDAGGVVYHAAYVRFFERARTEWLRAMGFDQGRLRDEEGVLFAVRSMEIGFRKPARFDDRLEVGVYDVSARRASLQLAQAIRREDGLLLCEARVRVACVDAESFAPVAIPAILGKELMDER